jgi:hypothetical protein
MIGKNPIAPDIPSLSDEPEYGLHLLIKSIGRRAVSPAPTPGNHHPCGAYPSSLASFLVRP